LRFELRTGALGASIKVGEFTHMGERMTLRIEESRDSGRDLSGIFVHVQTPKQDWIGVTAARGRFMATDDPNVIIFRLTDGTLVHNRPEFRTPRVLQFSAHDLPIDLPRFESFRQRGGRNLELKLPELARLGQDAATEQQRDSVRAEFHFRLVEVATMLLLPMLAVALGVPPKRSSSALGVFLAIVMLVTYHKINEYASDFGALGRVDPAVALWVPFTLFAALVCWMYYQVAHVPGGQPIAALERAFGKFGQAIVRRLPGRRRKAAP
jgi:lipopolysaccharide export system permease protein